jgi:cytochrome c
MVGMRKLMMVGVGWALTAAAGTAAQTTSDPAAGRALALKECTPCHVVAADQTAPRAKVGPDFHAIANTKAMTETSLHVFLSTPHPTMPNLILSPKERDDVVGYILSLRDRS